MDTDVMGPSFSIDFYNPVIAEHPASVRMHALYEEMNLKNNTALIQKEIDRYWYVIILHATNSNLLQILSWKHFILNIRDVFCIKHLPDLGPHIRELTISRNISTNVMCRIIQYSLPYVKHNRLNFPKRQDIVISDLVKLIQITLALLLGLYSDTSKRPVWNLRLMIINYIHFLLGHGNQYDLYLFCSKNVNIIRIALIEYFVYHVSNMMPCEYETLYIPFGNNCNVDYIFKQFNLNIDNYRATAFQGDMLIWSELNSRAHSVIEKCNRLCKGKPKILAPQPTQLQSHNVCINRILDVPRFSNVFYCKLKFPHLTLSEIEFVHYIHRNIEIMPLPPILVKLQSQHILDALQQNSELYTDCMITKICLRCISKTSKIPPPLRTSFDGHCRCTTCMQSDAIQDINLFGRLIRIFQKTYYMCHKCLNVHEWTGIGSEFFHCRFEPAKAPPGKKCLLCNRTGNVTTYTVMDENIGVKQRINFCHRHSPRVYECEYIHNMESLVENVKNRMLFKT